MSLERPLVVITTKSVGEGEPFAARFEVIKAVVDAGLTPLIVCAQLYQELDQVLAHGVYGVVIPGGSDISPQLYGAETGSTTQATDYERDILEIALIQYALSAGLPVLGLCRGAQAFAVAQNAQLIQEVTTIRGSIPHGNENPTYADLSAPRSIHSVTVRPNTHAARVLQPLLTQDALPVRSMHHQVIAADTLPDHITISGLAPDGTIAIVEDEYGNLSFQDHVEWGSTSPDPYWQQLTALAFAAFAERVQIAAHAAARQVSIPVYNNF
ncbi:gamma-glutamyl-gamma-aminobutyrate hydrolase family protein [Candidatus Woesebacteria bacterium]|nr:gamma-glutamyl-gamma-aminobutyrate hydrolase family protein [Candidatus Woesebacteria bacterium]